MSLFHFKNFRISAGRSRICFSFSFAQSCLWDWRSDSMKAQRKTGFGKGEMICGFLRSYIAHIIYRSYILLFGWFVRAIWSLLLRSTIAINADGWRSVSAMGSCLQTTNGGGADAGHWHRRTRKINGACGRCISTTRILRVAFCSFDRQCAGMYTDTARNEM